MVFSSTTFLFLFLPALLVAYFCRKGIRWRNGVLLVFSLIFYSFGEPVWVLGMIGVTLINWFVALRIYGTRRRRTRKLLLAAGVVTSLILLVYFKYSSFLANTVYGLLGMDRVAPERHLPIGISFYTFQVLTYTVDVYRKKAKPQTNPCRTLLYISCFPQLIAGPIVQYSDVAEALSQRKTTPTDFYRGLQRFVLGLGKKVLLANLCGEMLEATALGGTGAQLSLLGSWLSAALYTMQLYFDFSAYSDMAIGLGRVFGFSYKENFDHPYLSASVTEFWRRWHMSLSAFFRDYVYIPLGGNRRGTGRTILNLAIVWSLTGLWHGASWNFVLWGIYYFALLVLERFVLRQALDRTPAFLRHILTLLLVTVGWVIFYYTDFSAMTEHLQALVGLGGGGLVDAKLLSVLKQYTVLPLIMALCCLPLQSWLKGLFSRGHRGVSTAGGLLGAVARTAIFLLSLLFLMGQTYNPFIYFRF